MIQHDRLQPETFIVGLSNEEYNVLKDLPERRRIRAINKLRAKHKQEGHILALEHLEELDPRSEYFKVSQRYQQLVSEQATPTEALSGLEQQLKILHPISHSHDL